MNDLLMAAFEETCKVDSWSFACLLGRSNVGTDMRLATAFYKDALDEIWAAYGYTAS